MYTKFEVNTTYSPLEVIEIISRHTGEKQFFNTKSSKEFSGIVTPRKFKITKNISYNNSFLPVTSGIVRSIENGTKVSFKMRLHFFPMLFSLVWILAMLFGCITALVETKSLTAESVVPLGMLIFGMALVNGGFWYEALTQKARLIELVTKNQ